MTDVTGSTGPRPASTADHDVDALRIDREEATERDDDRVPTRDLGEAATGGKPVGTGRPDPVAAVRDPDNRARLLLGIGVLTVLNFLLLLGVLAAVMDRNDQVMVDGTPCIIDERDGEGVLFCQR